ncbi:hypothetical protein [Endozoicomonas sp. GU-1]|uniref:hypothetical protein n=1 Tax=Endozoicomonas sp. GU-1 TaxID=3009078 RepID=UPI0022B54F65|nr:hypothetical protein [Endozoicomonas sp. GU-1]WBA81262.1 hypothetical protein O2T12_23720 [Endozoicomonas sp. GU-1]
MIKSTVTDDGVDALLLINSCPVSLLRASSMGVSGVQRSARSWSEGVRAGKGCHWLFRVNAMLPGSSSAPRSVRQTVSSGHPGTGVIVPFVQSMG